jgi:uncharacterized protein YdgA (DUF945 family)
VDRRIRISIIVVVVVALAYPAAAWLLGLSVEHQWNERERRALEQIPYFMVVKRDYRRGVYSSTEELTYGLQPFLVKSLGATGHTDPADHVQFTIRNTIHHGPLPQLRAFAPATVDTELVLPPVLREKWVAVLGSEPGLSIHTRMKWLGGSTTLATSPAFQKQTPDGQAISWRGLDGKVELGRNLGSQSTGLSAPGLTLKSPTADASFEHFEFKSDLQPAFEVMSLGIMHATLGRLDIEEHSKGFNASVQNLSMDSKSTVNGEYLNMDVSLGTSALQAQQFAATKVVYEVHLGHAFGPAVAAMTKDLRAAQIDAAASANPDPYTTKVMEAFKTSGVEILLHDPVLQIPRVGFTTPDGELLMSISATLPGITRADFDVAPQLLGPTVLRHLQASLDIRIDTALLDKLLDSTGKGETIAGQLQGLQRQGYIKLDGKALTTHLVFQNGQLKVNDLPFPPMPAGGPGMPVPRAH